MLLKTDCLPGNNLMCVNPIWRTKEFCQTKITDFQYTAFIYKQVVWLHILWNVKKNILNHWFINLIYQIFFGEHKLIEERNSTVTRAILFPVIPWSEQTIQKKLEM